MSEHLADFSYLDKRQLQIYTHQNRNSPFLWNVSVEIFSTVVIL